MTSNKVWMKNSNNSNNDYDENDYDEDESFHKSGKKKYSPRKRPVRNWKKEWGSTDSDDDVDMFNKRMK